LDRGKVRITGTKLDTFNNALKKRLLSIAPCGSVFTTNRPGIIAEVERQLFKKRIGIKKKRAKLIKSLPDLRDNTLKRSKIKIEQYFSTQWALKIVLNAMFGITSVPYSRYFNINLSEAITSCGRFTIKEGEKFVNKLLNAPNDDIKAIMDKIRKETGGVSE
jgi:DNA polymerase elongation subunit (family B)